MTATLPFTRLYTVSDVPAAGGTVSLTATPEERAALAAAFGLPEVKRFDAVLILRPWGRDGLSVSGEISAEVVQVCVVTLEPFAAEVREQVDVRFAADEARPETGGEHEADLDAPDLLVNGTADLGALAAEHFALGLDPYPRKPGVEAPPDGESVSDSPESTHRPFAGLDKLVEAARKKKN